MKFKAFKGGVYGFSPLVKLKIRNVKIYEVITAQIKNSSNSLSCSLSLACPPPYTLHPTTYTLTLKP
jgi:hypothetical protein